MKKIFLAVFIIFSSVICRSQQSNHLYEHTFPEVNTQDPVVLEMLNQVTENQIISDVEHLSSYINRRADAIHIYAVKDWLVSQYENMNVDSVQQHEFESISYHGAAPALIVSAPNVLAIQIGKTRPEEIVICGAHYDSYVHDPIGMFDPDTLVSPGADDNATGVAGILTTARILSNYEFERTIIYANWNAEEFGLCGSKEYAKECHADSVDIVAYFNLDMTGYVAPGNNIHIHLLYKNCDSLLGNFTQQVSHTYLPGINIWQAWLSAGDTDYSSFNRNGYQAISPSEDVHNMSPYIHTIDDIIGLSVNSWEQSVIFTKLNLACVAHAAGLVYQSVNEIDYSDAEIEYFEVFDTYGHLVYKENNMWKNVDEILVNNLESGIYIVRFFTNNGNVFTKKFFLNY